MILERLQKLIPTGRYDALRLINYVESELASRALPDWLWVCDLDKTYLETAFESVMDLARTAMEKPGEKITVRGAKDCLHFFKWSTTARREENAALGSSRHLHFISSSPPQLRGVIAEKLQMDGLYWESMTLKDQLYNLKKRQPQRLRDHVSYKLLAIAKVLQQQKSAAKIILAGDFAEFDAFIYLILSFFFARRPSRESFQGILRPACDESTAHLIWSVLDKAPEHQVRYIFMRNLRAYRSTFRVPLTGGFWMFDGFEQIASCLVLRGLISPQEFIDLLNRLHVWKPGERKDLGRQLLGNALYNGEPIEGLLTLQNTLSEYLDRDYVFLSEEALRNCQRYPPRAIADPFSTMLDSDLMRDFRVFHARLAMKRHRFL